MSKKLKKRISLFNIYIFNFSVLKLLSGHFLACIDNVNTEEIFTDILSHSACMYFDEAEVRELWNNPMFV